MIPPKTVQDILETARIEEVVEEFVALRRRGTNLIGLCPFHAEKSPSFNVNPARNVFKCFGCGKGGDSVTFLREHEKMSFSEALKWLAKKYHIAVEEVERTPEQVAEDQHNESLYIVNEFAQRDFSEQLFDTDEGKSVALNYFKTRGLREETIRTFGLGWAPDSPRDRFLAKAKMLGYSGDFLKKLGLSNQAGDRDFFRARVIFPIHNLSGKVAAFAGRTLSSDKTIPKYINSPETEVYVKNKILYGAFQAKKAIRQHDECILTEGYMDVISLHQAGIENVVASSGTSLTEGQLNLIKRNTDNLKILYDGDPAGIKAALRGLDLALEQDLNVRIALLPPGEDPDSYVQRIGSEAFKEFVKSQSKDFILFKTELLLDETKGDPIKKSALVKDIVGSIARIPDPIKRSAYLKECSALMGMAEDILLVEANKMIGKTLEKREQKERRAGGAASDSARPAPGHDPSFPSEELGWPSGPPGEFVPGEPSDWLSGPPPSLEQFPQNFAPARPKSQPGNDEIQERDIVRLLVQSGHQHLEREKLSVAEFILADIEESLGSFDNLLLGKMASLAHEVLVGGGALDADFFLKHEEPTVSDLAVELMHEPYYYDIQLWEERFQKPLQNQPLPELNYERDARYAVTQFKIQKLQNLCTAIIPSKIKIADEKGDVEESKRLQKVLMKAQATRNALAKIKRVVF